MYVIGLTGGVGSGKSLVAKKMQQVAQAELLIADDLGYLAMLPGTDSFQKILSRFGTEILKDDGTLDRNLLASRVFEEEQALLDLNAIIHPVVKEYVAEYIHARADRDGLIILETAILFESGCRQYCDEVWYVLVPAQIRIDRLMQSRGYTEEKCRAIMQKQLSDGQFIEQADYVFENDVSIHDLLKKVEHALEFRHLV